ncbi:UDP-3-O-(3-hydroxymyristoyl)glucosamine N-acyltransferase [Hoeflea sp.]|uniref:UDP-3-O-(3-hydroxymyristoyl)glucosamine N-acyltransferase n=1 Tax=Hoeflea sp. TaxID=1940281 RepID=UPI003B015C78
MEDGRFFPPHSGVSLSELSAAIGAQLPDQTAAGVIVTGAASLARAKSGDICFFAVGQSLEPLLETAASAVICSEKHAQHVPERSAALVVDDPHAAFALAAALLYPLARRPVLIGRDEGVSPGASVHPTARLEDHVSIEAGAVIGAGVHLGSGTRIGPGVVVGPDCRIGRDCTLSAGVTIQHALIGNGVILHPGVRIGQDGFGYATGDAGPSKVVQIGRVILQDGVEIGANTTIDRGALDDTVIGEGTKIDNLVHIGHNVRIGRSCTIAGQAGIAGSVSIGDRVVIGRGSGVNDHVSIGDGAHVAGMSAVTGDVPASTRRGGVPAESVQSQLKDVAELNARAFGRKGNTKGSANE